MKARKKGFTLIELLVVIAIIAILAAMLLPALKSARDTAQKISCMANVKNIGMGIFLYAETYDSFFPGNYQDSLGRPLAGWETLSHSMVSAQSMSDFDIRKSGKYFRCPSIQLSANRYAYIGTTLQYAGGCYVFPNYGMNGNLGFNVNTSNGIIIKDSQKLSRAGTPTLCGLVSDNSRLYRDFGIAANAPGNRHMKTGNVFFVDGHTATMNSSEILLPGTVIRYLRLFDGYANYSKCRLRYKLEYNVEYPDIKTVATFLRKHCKGS